MNSQYRKNLKAVATACKNYTDRKIDNLMYLLGGYDLSLSTNDDSKYQKTISSDSISVNVNSVGGMSYKSDNLLVFEDVAETTTSSGITYSVINGILSFKNTPVSNTSIWLKIKDFKTISGTSYGFKTFNNRPETNISIALRKEYNVSTDGIDLNISGNIFTGNNNVYKYFLVYITTGFNDSELILKPDTIVSTTTPTEWVEGYEGIRDSAVTSIKINDNIVRTIPEAVQNLEGYGWGINDTCYNYIDFETKKFVKKVGKVDLGTLDWAKTTVFYQIVSGMKSLSNGICKLFPVIPLGGTTPNVDFIETRLNGSIYIRYQSDSPYKDMTAEEFKTAMSGVYLYYELDEPVETDVSEYITDFNPINLTTGYTDVEFVNQYNADMPNSITALVEEVKSNE